MGMPGLRKFFLSIVFPSILAILLFIISFYLIIIPSFERNMMEGKKEMIKELTSSALSLINEYYLEYENEKLEEDEAKSLATSRVGKLRYGDDKKDYFWITDMRPYMLMHPYRPELADLKDYIDPEGKRLFVDAVEMVREHGEGYIDYRWQWQDDSSLIVPKLSYVVGFPQWDWVIGTGIYLEDVKQEIKLLERNLFIIITSIILIISLALLYIIRQSMLIEKKRREAERDLLSSRQKYKILVESSTIGTLMISDNRIVYANRKFANLSGISDSLISNLKLEEIFDLSWKDLLLSFKEPGLSVSLETRIIVGNVDIPVLVSASMVSYEKGESCILVVNELSEKEIFQHHKLRLDRELQTRLLLMTHADAELVEDYLKCELSPASALSQFREKYIKMTAMAESLYHSGARAENITSLISGFADDVATRLIEKAITEEGPAPCDFCFIVMGSQGRMEETLATDQDNGIIIGEYGDRKDEALAYFKTLGIRISEYLNDVGYEYCKGGVMVSNPLWIKSLEEWKQQFFLWINESDPKSLLDINIFFDFRSIFGRTDLADELRIFVKNASEDKSVFFYHLSETVSRFKSASGDMKKLAMPITSFARLYALHFKIIETNTLRRLELIRESDYIDSKLIFDAIEAYRILSRLRLRTQISDIEHGLKPTNELNIAELTEIESAVLKKVVSIVNELIAKSRIDFKGIVS